MKTIIHCLDFFIIRTTGGDFPGQVFILRNEIDELLKSPGNTRRIWRKIVRIIRVVVGDRL